MKNYLLLLALAGAFTFTACNSDDDETPTPTKTDILTTGGWKISASTVNPAFDADGDGTTETDLMPLIKACTKDDVTNYKADKTYTEEEGATKCNPNDQDVFATGTWAFTNNETMLSLTKTGTSTPENYNIVELTTNTLKISHTFEDDGVTFTNTRTFTH